MSKKLKLQKPRCTVVNEILTAKKGGRHEDKSGEHAKRARQKELARKLIQDI